MSGKRAPRAPLTALEAMHGAVEILRAAKGQGHSDPLARGALQLAAVIDAANKVADAKDLYYCQRVDHDEAKVLALEAWADRVDELRVAVEYAEGRGDPVAALIAAHSDRMAARRGDA